VLGRLYSIAAVNDVAPNLHRQNRVHGQAFGTGTGTGISSHGEDFNPGCGRE
jgi:hypothetical protein